MTNERVRRVNREESILRKLWSAWRTFGRWMGDQVARVFLVVFYFTIALPFGLLVRLTQDPLDIRDRTGAAWVERDTKEQMLADAGRLF